MSFQTDTQDRSGATGAGTSAALVPHLAEAIDKADLPLTLGEQCLSDFLNDVGLEKVSVQFCSL